MVELKYSSDVNDMLCRLYNFMVRFNYEMNPVAAYAADGQLSGHTAKGTFYQKFIAEIDYIKELASVQPTRTIKVKTLFWVEADKQWAVASEQTEVLKSFNEDKLSERMTWYSNKSTDHTKTEIEILETTNAEYLTK